MSDALPENPLPPCPFLGGCARETRLFDDPPDGLYARAEAALKALGASDLTVELGTRRIQAVFKIFLFKDDVTLAVTSHDGGSALHIRSASRIGLGDYGVNRRRVRRFFQVLATTVEPRP